MVGRKVLFDRHIHKVIHDYGNGFIEIRRENAIRTEIRLVKQTKVVFVKQEN